MAQRGRGRSQSVATMRRGEKIRVGADKNKSRITYNDESASFVTDS
jgi:hypothetical protein